MNESEIKSRVESLYRTKELSLSSLQELLTGIPSNAPALVESFFFLDLCRHKSVTIEMVEYVLKQFPALIHRNLSESYDGHDHPLHAACWNDSCPIPVIRLLVEYFPAACVWRNFYGKTPIIHACGRKDVCVDLLEILMDENKECLSFGATSTTALHAACANEHITLEVVEFLVEENRAMLEQRDIDQARLESHFPIHVLCNNSGLDDETSMDILRLLMKEHPESVRWDDDWNLPLHSALTGGKSLKFCKHLVDAYP